MFYRIFDNNSSQQPRYTVVFDKHHPAAPNANVALVMATNISHICEHTSVPIRGELSQATAGELGVVPRVVLRRASNGMLSAGV